MPRDTVTPFRASDAPPTTGRAEGAASIPPLAAPTNQVLQATAPNPVEPADGAASGRSLAAPTDPVLAIEPTLEAVERQLAALVEKVADMRARPHFYARIGNLAHEAEAEAQAVAGLFALLVAHASGASSAGLALVSGCVADIAQANSLPGVIGEGPRTWAVGSEDGAA